MVCNCTPVREHMGSAYHPDFGTNVRYSFERMPEDSDGQVSTAIDKICGFLEDDSRSPIIQNDAAQRLIEGGGDLIAGVWPHIKRSLRFRQDADIAQDLDVDDARKDDIVEVFIRPVDQSLLIQLRGAGVEDCDGYTMYGACLLLAGGIPCNLVTVAADPSEPNRFSHIYVAAYPNGKRVPLDFSHGPYPGWEAPSTRIKEWPIRRNQSANILLLVAVLGAAYLGLRRYRRYQ
jgi:hypothetical protein